MQHWGSQFEILFSTGIPSLKDYRIWGVHRGSQLEVLFSTVLGLPVWNFIHHRDWQLEILFGTGDCQIEI